MFVEPQHRERFCPQAPINTICPASFRSLSAFAQSARKFGSLRVILFFKRSGSKRWALPTISMLNPLPKGSGTLDDEITEIETPISRMLSGMRAQPIGSTIDSTNAAEILNHLVPRTAHVRVSMERGLRMMADGVQTILNDDERLQTLMGLDEDEPNEVFRQNLADKLNEIEGLENLGLPTD